MESLLHWHEEVNKKDLETVSNALHIYYLYYNCNNVQLIAAQDNPLSLVILNTPYDAERLAVSRNAYLDLVKSIT